MATLIARVRDGKYIRTIHSKSTEQRILELQKALGLNPRHEAKLMAIRRDLRKVTLGIA